MILYIGCHHYRPYAVVFYAITHGSRFYMAETETCRCNAACADDAGAEYDDTASVVVSSMELSLQESTSGGHEYGRLSCTDDCCFSAGSAASRRQIRIVPSSETEYRLPLIICVRTSTHA